MCVWRTTSARPSSPSSSNGGYMRRNEGMSIDRSYRMPPVLVRRAGTTSRSSRSSGILARRSEKVSGPRPADRYTRPDGNLIITTAMSRGDASGLGDRRCLDRPAWACGDVTDDHRDELIGGAAFAAMRLGVTELRPFRGEGR